MLRGVTGNQGFTSVDVNDMKKFIVVLAMIFAIALLAQTKAQAGVFFPSVCQYRSLFRSFTGRRITQAVITMALTDTRITRDPTGTIGIGLTDTGATIEKVPSGSPIRPFNCSLQK